MKRIGLILVALIGFGVLAQADTQPVEMIVTNGQAITYSDQIPASGILEKIEVVQTAGATATVTIATYSGTTAVDSIASLASLVGNKVVRPAVFPTDSTGTALVGGTGTNFVNRPVMLGGNMKMAVTSAGASSTGSNTVKAILYFQRTSR